MPDAANRTKVPLTTRTSDPRPTHHVGPSTTRTPAAPAEHDEELESDCGPTPSHRDGSACDGGSLPPDEDRGQGCRGVRGVVSGVGNDTCVGSGAAASTA